MTELKPCPFCGGKGKYHGSYFEDDVCEYVSCTRCNSSTPLMYKKGESIEWWNRKASPWHIGTPTEEGWYLLQTKETIPFRVAYMRNNQWLSVDDSCIRIDVVLAWQRITPYVG